MESMLDHPNPRIHEIFATLNSQCDQLSHDAEKAREKGDQDTFEKKVDRAFDLEMRMARISAIITKSINNIWEMNK